MGCRRPRLRRARARAQGPARPDAAGPDHQGHRPRSRRAGRHTRLAPADRAHAPPTGAFRVPHPETGAPASATSHGCHKDTPSLAPPSSRRYGSGQPSTRRGSMTTCDRRQFLKVTAGALTLTGIGAPALAQGKIKPGDDDVLVVVDV